MRRKTSPPAPDPQARTDAAAWKFMLRRRPEVAARIQLALAAGQTTDRVVAAAAEGWPRLRLFLPCAVHGCARSLGLLQEAPRRTA